MRLEIMDVHVRNKFKADLQAIPDLQIFGMILRCGDLFDKLVIKNLKEYGISKTHWDVLCKVYFDTEDQKIKLSELGRRMMVSKANITGLANRMEDNGLIKKISESDDARVKEITITDKGFGLLEKVLPNYKDLILSFFNDIDAKERERLLVILTSLHTTLDNKLTELN